ncbi:unnamed protein product [Soboliphyme baturini]|uniref:RRM domain-containing protein n=1 Tax=Soboliphyme baturini TaxID=241478 RepID=A0A183IHA0_9BILA|nr:unnamed protein product [Soboliphyme baturini]
MGMNGFKAGSQKNQDGIYRGDPEDKTLRHVERDVVIPKRVQDKVAKEKCHLEYKELSHCLKLCGIKIHHCNKLRDKLNACLLNWYYDPEFVQSCTEEYLHDRSEYRRTGHASSRLKQEIIDDARRQHLNGKRHLRAQKRKFAQVDPHLKTIFLCGFKPFSLNKNLVTEYFQNRFGPVSKVTIDSNKGTFAFVEFIDPASATAALELKKHIIDTKVKDLPAKTEDNRFPVNENADGEELYNKLDVRIRSSASFADQIDAVYDMLRLNDYANRIAVKDLIEAHITSFFVPYHISLHIYGSSTNGFGSRISDLDMTVLFSDLGEDVVSGHVQREPDYLLQIDVGALAKDAPISQNELKSLTHADAVTLLYRILKLNSRLCNPTLIITRKCPIVRFNFCQYLCQLSYNNVSAVNNTRWLHELSQVSNDWLPKLVGLARYWISKCEKVQGVKSDMDGYAIMLLMITFLKLRGLASYSVESSNDSAESASLYHWSISNENLMFFVVN